MSTCNWYGIWSTSVPVPEKLTWPVRATAALAEPGRVDAAPAEMTPGADRLLALSKGPVAAACRLTKMPSAASLSVTSSAVALTSVVPLTAATGPPFPNITAICKSSRISRADALPPTVAALANPASPISAAASTPWIRCRNVDIGMHPRVDGHESPCGSGTPSKAAV